MPRQGQNLVVRSRCQPWLAAPWRAAPCSVNPVECLGRPRRARKWNGPAARGWHAPRRAPAYLQGPHCFLDGWEGQERQGPRDNPPRTPDTCCSAAVPRLPCANNCARESSWRELGALPPPAEAGEAAVGWPAGPGSLLCCLLLAAWLSGVSCQHPMRGRALPAFAAWCRPSGLG